VNPADYGMTWQEVAEKRLEYIRRLGKQIHLYMGIVERLANDFPDVWDEVSE